MRPHKHHLGSSTKRRRDQAVTEARPGERPLKERRLDRRVRDASVSGISPLASRNFCDEGISSLIREICNIPHTEIAVFTTDEALRVHTFTSPNILHQKEALQKCQDDFKHMVRTSREDAGRVEFKLESTPDDASTLASKARLQPSASPKSQLRARSNLALAQSTSLVKPEFDSLSEKRRNSWAQCSSEDDKAAPDSEVRDVIGVTMGFFEGLKFGDQDAVKNYYKTRLLILQQLACKHIAKAWIKIIHPRKQSQNPYRGNDKSKPVWWPEGVRHKEPDHLRKEERMTLLLHILSLEQLDIEKLEKATDDLQVEVIVNRGALLTEIYKVAKAVRRLTPGLELDPNTLIWVRSEPKSFFQNIKKEEGQEEEDDDGDGDGDDNGDDGDDDSEDDSVFRMKRESRDESIDTIMYQQEEEMPEESVQGLCPSLCELATFDGHLCPSTNTGNVFSSSYIQDTSPMDTSSFVVSESTSVFPTEQLLNRRTLMAGSPDGGGDLERAHTFQGRFMPGQGWQSTPSPFTCTQDLYGPFIHNPPTVPSQPGNSTQYPLLAPRTADVQEHLLGLTQGQQSLEQIDLAAVANAMMPNDFGQPALMGSMCTEPIGDIQRLQQNPAEYGQYPGQGGNTESLRRYNQGQRYTFIKEENLE